MANLVFPCGCKFKIVGDNTDRDIPVSAFDKLPRVDISLNPWDEHSIYRVSTTCKAVWDMLGEGKTKGVFQLEAALGRQWSKKTKPGNLEDLGALVALLRPGCISGDTLISIKIYDRPRLDKSTGRTRFRDLKKISIRELYASKDKSKSIVSLDEQKLSLFNNNIDNVIFNGFKEVVKPKFRTRISNIHHFTKNNKFHNLECTLDHKLLVHKKGWTELKDIKIGDRVAVINPFNRKKKTVKYIDGQTTFRDICFQNYEYRCTHCDWDEGSLDVNHIDGNRTTNNRVDNLCYMCPNHHRMYTENNISKEDILEKREKYKILNSDYIFWAEYDGYDTLGIKDVYDISVDGPNHNFVAGNVVVHNCLRAMSGDPPKSMTQRYADRKMGKEEITYLHKSIASVLETTYGVLTYQEQAMRIAELVAAFNKQEADVLRKAIGKKKADVMAKVEKEFLEKAEKAGVITLDEAKEIFGWIRESQKYSFNKSHAVAYGKDAYWSAYIKAHFPLTFYGAWILGANWKQADKFEEIAELLNDAKLNNIEVKTPQLHSLTETTDIVNDEFIQFGLTEIKGVGGSTSKQILSTLNLFKIKLNKPIKDWTWMEFLLFVAPELGKVATTALISVGALDFMGDKISRTKRLFEYNLLLEQVKDKELEWLQERWDTYKWPTFIEALTAVQPVRKMEKKIWVGGGGTTNVNRAQKIASCIALLNNPPSKLIDTIEWIALTEEKYLGTPVTITKIDGVEEACEANTTCKEYLAGREGYMVFALEVVNIEETKTKKGKTPGQKMAKIKVRDSSCTIDAVVFPKQWAEFGSAIYEGSTILAIGERTREGGLSIKKAKEIG